MQIRGRYSCLFEYTSEEGQTNKYNQIKTEIAPRSILKNLSFYKITFIIEIPNLVYIPYIFGIYTLHIWYIYLTYLVYIPYIFGIYTLHIWYIYLTYLVYIPYIFGIYTLHIWYIYLTYLVYIPFIFGIYTLHILQSQNLN